MTDKNDLSAEEILEMFEPEVDGGFHWPYDGERIATIIDGHVAPDTRPNGGDRLEVTFKLQVEDNEKPEHEIALSIGATSLWETNDGETFGKVGGGSGLRENAWFQVFLQTLLSQGDEVKKAITTRGVTPYGVPAFLGLKAKWEPIVQTYGKDNEGKTIKSVRPLPVEFISLGDVPAAGAPAAPAAAAPAPNIDDVMASLKAIAQTANDATDFMVKALPIAPPELTTKVADGSLYTELTAA